MSFTDHFMLITPRHKQALELLVQQRSVDQFGGIGVGALRDEDDVFTLEQIVMPLWERGLIEDLTGTALGDAGRHFVRITEVGVYCLNIGYMLRNSRRTSEEEIHKYLEGETMNAQNKQPANEPHHDADKPKTDKPETEQPVESEDEEEEEVRTK